LHSNYSFYTAARMTHEIFETGVLRNSCIKWNAFKIKHFEREASIVIGSKPSNYNEKQLKNGVLKVIL